MKIRKIEVYMTEDGRRHDAVEAAQNHCHKLQIMELLDQEFHTLGTFRMSIAEFIIDNLQTITDIAEGDMTEWVES